MTNCLQCAHPTNRHNHLCPNCHYADSNNLNPQSYLEAIAIETYKFTCECGEARTPLLILMCKGGTFHQSGPPSSNRPGPRNVRAISVADDPSLWYVRCQNCHWKASNRRPGRPPKHTEEERKWHKANYPKIYKVNLNMKVVQSYGIEGQWPECISCLQPATRVLYIGEFGKAPLGNHYWRCRKLSLTDPTWHAQFAPYCDHHEVMNIGQRAKQKKQIQAEQLLETLWKSSRTLAELELV